MRRLRGRGSAWIAAAALIGVFAALLAIRAASSEGPGATVVVARQSIPAGTLIGSDRVDSLLASATVPAGLDLRGLLEAPSDVEGHRTTAPLAPGEPVTLAVLGGGPGSGPAPLRSGERAVTVPLAAAGSAAASLAPGVRVDAVASTGDGLAGRSEVVVTDAEVLIVDDVGAPDSQLLSGAVVVRVSAPDALRLTEALNFAREVRLLVRPFDEPDDG